MGLRGIQDEVSRARIALDNLQMLSKALPNPELVTPMANGEAASAWRNDDGTYLIAHANDIVTWNGSHWFVIFNSSSVADFTYITNIRTGLQYVWDGTMWSKSYEGEYSPTNWRLIL